MNTMNLLWGFDLKKPLDERGNVIEPNVSDYVQVRLNQTRLSPRV